jgi:60 kDa SS-A/Ro ribonucleoprotein
MPRDPLAAVTTLRTPQAQPIPGRTDQVRNNAGGYGFTKDTFTRLEDFVILGTTGGTYYVAESKHTFDNVQVVFDAVAQDGPRAVALAVDVSTGRPPRAPKNEPALFLLAAAITRGDLDTRRAARDALPQVARTTNHQSAFFGYWKNLHGKPAGRGGSAPKVGRLVRGAFADLFLAGEPDQVAFRACKAMARKTPTGEPFALRDLLRIAHPQADSEQRRALFGWIAGNVTDERAREFLPSVDRFLAAKAVTSAQQAVRVVTERGVPWEFLPDAVLTSPEVWEALVDTVGVTALIRNLARMTRIGALKPMGDATRRAAARLADAQALAQGRIHPLDVFLALRVYASGVSQPNPRAEVQRWTPVPAILDALEESYELSFGHVEPSGRRLLVAVDSSGSMSGHWGARVVVGGSPLGSPYEIGCAMAVIMARIERGNVHVIDVDTAVRPSKVTGRTNLREIAHWEPSGGGTDLSLPFSWARSQRLEVDGVLVLTDDETWAGRSHPVQELAAYRAQINPNTRLTVAAMTAAGHSIGDPNDPGALNIAGFDASLPQLVAGFVRG